MTSGTESEVMWPQAKEHQQLLEAGRGKVRTASQSIRRECSPAHTLISAQRCWWWISGFWSHERIICYINNRKRIQVCYFLSPRGKWNFEKGSAASSLCSEMRQHDREWAAAVFSDEPRYFQRRGLKKAAWMRTQGRHCRPPPALPPTSADSPWKHCEEKSGKCDCFRRVQVPNIQMPMSSWWLLSLHLTLRISTLSSSLISNCFWNILSEILHRHLCSMYFLKGVYYLPLTLVLSLSLFNK